MSFRLVAGSLAVATGMIVFNACVGDDPATTTSGNDGSVGQDTSTDANGADTNNPGDSGTSPCDLTADFPDAVPVPGLQAANSIIRFSADEKAAYFALSGDGGVSQIYAAKRDSVGAPFNAAAPVFEVNDVAGESTPWLSFDDLTLFYIHAQAPDASAGARDIWYAQRTDAGATFANPMAVPNVNSGVQDDYLSESSNRDLWFVTTRSGDGLHEIYRAPWVGGYGTPVPVDGVNSPTADQYYPVLSTDLLQIFFTRNSIAGDSDIWTATRNAVGDPFSNAHKLTSLTTTDDDRPAWISTDSCRLYITRGGPEVAMVSTRPPK